MNAAIQSDVSVAEAIKGFSEIKLEDSRKGNPLGLESKY
jgi:hypothetical protein